MYLPVRYIYIERFYLKILRKMCIGDIFRMKCSSRGLKFLIIKYELLPILITVFVAGVKANSGNAKLVANCARRLFTSLANDALGKILIQITLTSVELKLSNGIGSKFLQS